MKRLLFAIPIVYYPDGFWSRDSGLIVRALREMGYDASMIALQNPSLPPRDSKWPIITCTVEDMQNPDWWSAQKPDAICLSLWSAPRYDSIRKAALMATPRVIERLDASGVRTPRIWPSYYFVQCWGAEHADFKSFILAAMRLFVCYFFPNALERPMALTMAQLPAVVAESPLAAARVLRHIRWHSSAPVRVAQISNPVDTRVMHYGPSTGKVNALVAVGRWDAFQKDFPLLLASASDFLERYPDWTFDVVGKGFDLFSDQLARIPEGVRKRIHFHGNIPYEQVGEINRRAKIHFIASRWEGFCNASIEALCCGCSYVGPINLAGSSYLIENRSGTIAARRRRGDLFDALCAEAEAWEGGRREPSFIAEKWTSESGYHQVATRTLELLKSISADQ